MEATSRVWKPYQKIAFRILAPFFILMCIPLTLDWYKHAFRVDWLHPHCRDFYDIVLIHNVFVKPSLEGWWGIGNYVNWGIHLLIALLIGIIWTLLDRRRDNYIELFKCARLIVRYRIAIGVIGFSFEKMFPTQMPYPSLANLITDFGDFDGHKIFWQSIGIVPWYEVFGGVMELIPGVLLLFRRTATWGAILTCTVLLTIVFINLGHHYSVGGIHVYAAYFVLLSIFILLPDIKGIWNVLVLEKFTVPTPVYPSLDTPFLKKGSRYVKIFLAIYFIGFGYFFYLNFRFDPYKQPSTPGVKALRGFYDVVEFRLNDTLLPYDPMDSVRWSDATFESWSTFAFRVNKKFYRNTAGGKSSSNTGHSSVDLEKGYEVSGVAGGRRAFHYFADTLNHTLYLQDKKKRDLPDIYGKDWIPPAALKSIGNDNHLVHPRVWSTRRDRDFAKLDRDLSRDKMVLHYVTQNGENIILTGTDGNKDSIYVVLKRVERKQTLSGSSIHAGTY